MSRGSQLLGQQPQPMKQCPVGSVDSGCCCRRCCCLSTDTVLYVWPAAMTAASRGVPAPLRRAHQRRLRHTTSHLVSGGGCGTAGRVGVASTSGAAAAAGATGAPLCVQPPCRLAAAQATREAVVAALDESGYCIVEGLLAPSALRALRCDLVAALEGSPYGRNKFEGGWPGPICSLPTDIHMRCLYYPISIYILPSPSTGGSIVQGRGKGEGAEGRCCLAAVQASARSGCTRSSPRPGRWMPWRSSRSCSAW